MNNLKTAELLKRCRRDRNSKIGTLGETFVKRRVELGIEFDEAWDQWKAIEKKLLFIIDCPEVQYYDNRQVADAMERRRIRDLAQHKLGTDIKSSDVSMLANVANWIQLEVPVRPYHMDQRIVVAWMAATDYSSEIKLAESDEAIDCITGDIEQFAEEHSLWAVPPERLFAVYANHLRRLVQVSSQCDACGADVVFYADPNDGAYQWPIVTCEQCGHENRLQVHVEGKAAQVLG
jgi:hypothetical protein